MSKTYDMLASSFTEIIDDYKNNGGENLTYDNDKISLRISEVKQYTGSEVKRIRTSKCLTQNLLAKYIGVSKKLLKHGKLA